MDKAHWLRSLLIFLAITSANWQTIEGQQFFFDEEQRLPIDSARFDQNNQQFDYGELIDVNRDRGIIEQILQQIRPAVHDNESPVLTGPVNDPKDFNLVYLTRENRNDSTNDKSIDGFLDELITKLTKDDNEKPSKYIIENYEASFRDRGKNIENDVKEINEGNMNEQMRMNSGEFIDHPLALVGHQYVQGGAGEGKQLLGPDGTFENVQVIKSDDAVPSYCDPPNPCPIGYTAADNCLEEFVNSASFSREYQAMQQCSCDNEHSLFNCAVPISTLNQVNSQATLNQLDNANRLSLTTDNNLHNVQDGLSTNQKQWDLNVLPFNYENEVENDINDRLIKVNEPLITTPVDKLTTIARTIQNRFGGIQGLSEFLSEQSKYVN